MNSTILLQFGPAAGLSSPSPFCIKLETFLRLAEVPFESRPGDPRKSPTGKLPALLWKGETLLDSQLIQERLSQELGLELDSWLSPGEQAQARAIRLMLKDHFYWTMVYSRWIDEANWSCVREVFFKDFPLALKLSAPPLVRKSVRKSLWEQGMGRYDVKDIYQMGLEDLKALADWMSDGPWVLGERPCSLDAVCFAFLISLMLPPIESPMRAWALENPRLTGYVRQVADQLYPGMPSNHLPD